MRRHRLAATAALPLILILAACTSGAAATQSPTQAPSVPAASVPAASVPAASTPAESPAASAEASAQTSETYDLKISAGSGATTNFLTGEDGKTLYVFAKDVVNSGKSVCNGGCAGAWPPFAAESLDEVKPDSGVTGKLALITRDDGSKQVSYNGMPLYYFGGDKAAGDTNGAAIPSWAVAHP